MKRLTKRWGICLFALPVSVLLLGRLALGAGATRPSTDPSAHPANAELAAGDDPGQAAKLRAAYLKPRDQWPMANVDDSVTAFKEIGPVEPVVFPADNPFSEAKANLGKQLFFDPRLSSSKAIACASCHDPDLAWSDGRTNSFGHERQSGTRNAPSIMGAAYQKYLFWDGRAKSLEEQALTPIDAGNEMHADNAEVVKSLSDQEEYRREFKDAFGADTITMDRVAQAIATFERTVLPGRSKFDAFVSGKSDSALTDSALRGLHLFRTKARCINCHCGPNFSDGLFHNIGLTYYGRKYQDLGRYNVTKDPSDVGRFRTPSLRNVARTGPYMHNGLFELAGVVSLYNAGGPSPQRTAAQEDDPLFPVKDPLLQRLGLSKQDKEDLLAFLDSLSEPKLRVRPPELPGLNAGDARKPATRAAGD